jgi:uncharacterized membrane protein
MKSSNDTVLDEKVDEETLSCPTGRIFFSPFTDRALKLSLPFILCAVYLLFLKYVYVPKEDFYRLGGLMLLYFLPPAGKESVIPLGLASGYSWYLMAASLTVLDVLTCMFMIWNFDLLCKAPVFGGWIETCSRVGRRLLHSAPLIERLSVIGLSLFVLLPVQGSGGIAATVLGKVLGIPPWHIFFAVSIGSLLGSILIAFGIHSIEEYFKLDPVLLVSAALLILLIGVSYRYFSNKADKRKEENKKE